MTQTQQEDLLTVPEVAKRLDKQCSQCKQIRCLEQFHRRARSVDGFRSECKMCRKAERETEEFKEKRRAKHKEKTENINKAKRARYHAHPERAIARSKSYRARNPEKVRGYQQEYNRSEQGKLRSKDWRQRNPEKTRVIVRNYIATHRIQVREMHQVASANYKAKMVEVDGTITVSDWRKIKVRYNCTCARCGRREPEIILTPDHVYPFHVKGINSVENIQPLCLRCNISKGVKVNDYRDQTATEQSA